MKPLNKSKRILSFLVVVLAFGLVFGLTLTGDSVRAVRGAQSVTYPIYLDNNESVAGFQVNINYSTSDLNLLEIRKTSRTQNVTIVYKDESPYLKMVVLANNASEEISAGNGSVLNLVFNVNSSAVPGNYSIGLNDLVSSDISAISLESFSYDGNFEISESYEFEFLPPISNFDNFTLQEGATLPLKFNVTDLSGFVYDDSVIVRIYNLSLGIDHTYNASGVGNGYVGIQDANQYSVNIHTGSTGLDMPEGLYDIDVSFDNYQIESIGFELVDKENGIGKGKDK